MADIIISPLVDAIIGNLVSAATNEIKMLWGVKEEVDRLRRTLSAIQEVLDDAEERQVTSTAVNNWLRKLKDVAYKAEDIVDDFATEALQAKPEESITKTSKRNQVSRFFSCLCFKKVVAMHEIGLKIKEVRQRLDDIAIERHHFHLKSSDGGRPLEVSERPKTSSLIDESKVIGRDDDKKILIQILITNDDTGKNISVVPIVGMGGSGKTTLAQLVYNDTLIENQFEKRAWVCVSDSFDVARITKEIIESATEAKCEFEGIEPLQRKLLNNLRGKKFIIVLDDVWNENKIHDWENLCLALKDGARGSKIIVTTRSDKVAQMMGTVSAHKIGVLLEDDSWRLFEKMAFGGESSEAPQTLVNIGKQILRKCGGLPLAIKTMGALLSSNRNESKWNNVLLSKIWELDEGKNDILPALRLSYQHLSSNLKQCFTYCSLFPKDYIFDRHTLIELWIAEGYVKPRAGMEMEEVGQDLFEDLLSRSFFQHNPFSGSSDVKMHDLVHDMAEFFSKEECVKIEGVMSFDILKNARRTSIINREGFNLIKLDDWNKFNNLRTLLTIDICFKPSDGLLDDVLRRCKRLRVLSLHVFNIPELPNSIGNLKHLRYLDLSSSDIHTLPESIGGLYNLHTLNLSYCEGLEELPESIGGLYNLQTLKLKDCENFTKLPDSIGGLCNLHTLNLSYCKDLEELPESIGGLYNLQTLKLKGCENLTKLQDSIGGLYNLQTLILHGCKNLTKLPDSIGGLRNLHTLNLSCCGDLEELPESIGGLYNLQTLKLKGCGNLTKLPSGITNLICLQHLEVEWFVQLPYGIGKLSQLVTLPVFKVGIRENECKLGELRDLVKLRGAICISGLQHVSNREEAKEANLKNKECFQEVTLEWDNEGNSLNNEEVLDGLQPPVNITELEIDGYRGDTLTPSWLSKFDQMITFVNLVEVKFKGCSKCKSLPPLGQLPSLKILYLCGMEELKILGDEFCGDNGTFPSLEVLWLTNLNSLEKWSGGKEGGGEYMPCLRQLIIMVCPKLKQLPEKGLPTSLKDLQIRWCPILAERCRKETGEDWPKISHIPQLDFWED